MSGSSGECNSPARLSRTEAELYLLSLDGGGVRGLSSLLVLKQIMEAIDPTHPPKPCDYFDMIGGTSTGGLIAIMLGRMRLSVDECIHAYSELAPEAFAKVHHRIKLRNGDTQGRFDHSALREGIRSLLKTHGMDPESLLETKEDNSCKVFVCATSQQVGRPVVFSTYRNTRRGNEWGYKLKIWEAARATSAATTFFEPITINGETFVDGATGANNPVNYLWSEAGDVWGDGGGLDASKVQCLVSIGTGTPALVAFGPDVAGVGRALKAISTETEITANTFQKHHSRLFQDGYAFRFNVSSGLEHVGLHEIQKWDVIKSATREYLQAEDIFIKLRRCAFMLRERQWIRHLFDDIIEFPRPSIEYFADPQNQIERDDLQRLTHTTAYQLWVSNKPLSSTLWYRFGYDQDHSSRNSVAASLARLQATPSLDGKPCARRFLYFQCRTEPNDEWVSARHVLVSLICQSILLGSSRFEDISARLLALKAPRRRNLRMAFAGPKDISIAGLLDLLATVANENRPDCIALDNIHCISELELGDFLYNLRSTFDKAHEPALCGMIPMILSGLDIPQVALGLSDTSQIDDKTEYNECVQSLHFRNWNTRLEQIDNPEQGTNEWICSHPQYEAWYAAHQGVLWVEGKPGSGKSVLARSLQTRIVASWKGTDNDTAGIPSGGALPTSIVAGWFYSSRLGDGGRSHLSLLRSIIYQLVSQEPSLFDSIVEVYRQFPVPFHCSNSGQEEESRKSWCESAAFEIAGRKILERISASGTSITCIVDAMDEAESSLNGVTGTPAQGGIARISSILGVLSSLVVGVAESRMKFIVLSRPEPLLELDFLRTQRKLNNTFRITLEYENRPDIEILVSRGIEALKAAIHTYDSDADDVELEPLRVHRIPRIARQTVRHIQVSEAETLRRIREYILENARGIILWVTLILEELQHMASGGMVTLVELEARLKSLPLELDDLYDRIIRDLSSRLTCRELSKSRDIFLLVGGAGSLGLPLTVEELWEAMAVPADVEQALKSKSDPIIANRAIISSWSNFRRQLVRYCGTLIEIVKPGATPSNDRENDLEPGDTVHFIHRTVKDFLEGRPHGDTFHIAEEHAIMFVKQLATRYLRIAFPRKATPYWAHFKATPGRAWKENIAGFVEYMDQRILFLFATRTRVLSDRDATKPRLLFQVLDDIGLDGSILDNMIDPPAEEWNKSDVINAQWDELRYYPGLRHWNKGGELVRGVLLGYAVYYACLNGCLAAAITFPALHYLGVLSYHDRFAFEVLNNAALRAAIQLGLEDETILFTRNKMPLDIFNNTDMVRFKVSEEPFLTLASDVGNSAIFGICRDWLIKSLQVLSRASHYGALGPDFPELLDSVRRDIAMLDEKTRCKANRTETSESQGSDNSLLQAESRKAVRLTHEFVIGLQPPKQSSRPWDEMSLSELEEFQDQEQ